MVPDIKSFDFIHKNRFQTIHERFRGDRKNLITLEALEGNMCLGHAIVDHVQMVRIALQGQVLEEESALLLSEELISPEGNELTETAQSSVNKQGFAY